MTKGRATVTVTDKGAAQRVAELMTKFQVDVGIMGKAAGKVYPDPYNEEPEDKTVGEVALENEYGLGGKPARPWCRTWTEENLPLMSDLINRNLTAVWKGQLLFKDAIDLSQQQLLNSLLKHIEARVDPPNADYTIERKGSDVPLIDTGLFFNSLSARVKEVK